MHRGWLVVLLLSIAACVKPPVALRAGPFEDVSVAQAQQQDLAGKRVRWGGTIALVETRQSETCFEVVNRPLDCEARPLRTDQTDGRFFACAPGFYDPVVYDNGRELTVTGTLAAPVTRKIGEYDYRYPSLTAEQVYLWPKREPRPVYYDPWPGVYWWHPVRVVPPRH